MTDQANVKAIRSNRREFLAAAGAMGAAAAVGVEGGRAAAGQGARPDATPAMPLNVLGRTGMTVSRLAFGGSWNVDSEVIAAGMELGVNYIDTAEGYLGGRSERAFGEILTERGATGHSRARQKLWLVTKSHRHRQLETQLPQSLERLKQDYVDCCFMHQIQDPRLASDPEVKAMAERLKKSGKTRFFGFSCHDEPVVECLNAAAAGGFVDVIMFRYDCHYYKRDDLMRAIDACTKAKIGLVAMKTQVGGMTLPDKFDPFKKRGLNQHQAAIKAVAADERIHAICSEITTTRMVEQNAEAVASKLTVAEAEAIQEHSRLVSHLWCRGCDSICRKASGAGAGLAVADMLRFLMYHDHYGKQAHARGLYADLPAERRDRGAAETADWAAAERACPHGVPLTRLIPRAIERLA
ncbi:MAG TPA: aldo/keto reductase [Chthonomonadaceae bacterium]|nr:aldo/keto reductase [Chthonomonadaceae bacterium]